jgi:hypothetical protein
VIGLMLLIAFAVFIEYLGSPSQTGCSVQQEERSVSSAFQCGLHAHPAHPNMLDSRWFSWLVAAAIVAYVLFTLRAGGGIRGTLRRLAGRR